MKQLNMCIYTNIHTINKSAITFFIYQISRFICEQKAWRICDSWSITIFPEDSGNYLSNGNQHILTDNVIFRNLSVEYNRKCSEIYVNSRVLTVTLVILVKLWITCLSNHSAREISVIHLYNWIVFSHIW